MSEFLLDNEKLFWCIIIFVAIGDLVMPYLLAPFYKGYSHKTMVMSSLGNSQSPVRTYYNGWLVLAGILLVTFSLFFYAKYNYLAVTIMLLIFSLGAMIIAGLFSVNESKEIVTLSSKIHGYGSAIGFMVLLFVPLVLVFQKYDIKYLPIISSICFILAFVSFSLFVMSDKPKFNNTIISFEGVWQRLSLLFMYLPLVYMAVIELVEQYI